MPASKQSPSVPLRPRRWRRGVLGLAIASGVLYYSWPLGNILNPVANRGLASNLEALHEPYNWLFILLDVLSGALAIVVAAALLAATKKIKNRLLAWSIWGYGLFGLLTLIDALLPIDCVDVQQRCGSLIGHPMIILHGIASLGSIGFLTISIVGLWYLLAFHPRASQLLKTGLSLIVITWFMFGVVTGTLIAYGRSSALSQHLFITVCSLWMGLLPLLVYRAIAWRVLLPKKVNVG